MRRCRLCLHQQSLKGLPVCESCYGLLLTGTTVDGLFAACRKAWEEWEAEE